MTELEITKQKIKHERKNDRVREYRAKHVIKHEKSRIRECETKDEA